MPCWKLDGVTEGVGVTSDCSRAVSFVAQSELGPWQVREASLPTRELGAQTSSVTPDSRVSLPDKIGD